MTKPIRRACVIGAGVMGSGIAAHFANAGIEVLLLDIVPPNLSDAEKKSKKNRDSWASGGLQKAVKARPAAFFHSSLADLVTTGNTEDDLDKLGDCDLVIEAIIEKLEAKQDLFGKLEKVINDECIVASNTSGLRIEDMLQGRTDSFKKRFLVMHFFNPVRYMKLLELVAGPETDPAIFEKVVKFGKNDLGKGIVVGKDTPNFVGNRIGVQAMMTTIHEMIAAGLTPEDVDNITGQPMAHPKSASFRTADLVGLDTFVHVADNCYAMLTEDEERDTFKVPDYLRTMVEKKLLGNKTRGGCYKKSSAGIEVFDYKTLEYRPKGGSEDIKKLCKKIAKIEDPRERVRALFKDEGPAGQFAWKVISKSLAYSARRLGEITDNVAAIDDSMKWGYNWELGPFEVWDALGFKAVYDRMKKDGLALPASIDKMAESGATCFYDGNKVYEPVQGKYVTQDLDPREVKLQVLRRGEAPVLKNESAEAWDLGDGVLGVTFKSKANSIDDKNITLLNQALDEAEQNYEAVLLVNEGEHFCVGANLFGVVMAANGKQWDQLDKLVDGMQQTMQKMKYSRIPVVAAPYGMALGGGLEICLAADAVQAAAETYSGLVEVGVGLLPGGAGNLNLLWRAMETVPEGAEVDAQHLVTQVFKNIAMAKVATSAVEAKHLKYFRHGDGVSFDRARHVYEAKQKAIGMARSGYHPQAKRSYKLLGERGIALFTMMVDTLVAGGFATEHDHLIAKKVATVLCGGVDGHTKKVTEQEILDLEREAFISLCGEKKSIDRMQYMLMNNKPLRN